MQSRGPAGTWVRRQSQQSFPQFNKYFFDQPVEIIYFWRRVMVRVLHKMRSSQLTRNDRR
jgi:hypothetical protein